MIRHGVARDFESRYEVSSFPAPRNEMEVGSVGIPFYELAGPGAFPGHGAFQ